MAESPHKRQRLFFSRTARVRAVGVSQYQDELLLITGLEEADERPLWEGLAILTPEPTNPHDPNAVQVVVETRLVGYLDRETAARLRPVLQAIAEADRARVAVPCRITGGFRLRDGSRSHLGVQLLFSIRELEHSWLPASSTPIAG
jgi:HIRAN domain